MKLNIYGVQDVLTGFAQPFCFENEEVAKRSYQDFLELDKHPEDKRLFKLGTFDNETGKIEPIDVPLCVQGGGEKNGEN